MTREELIDELYKTDRGLLTGISRSPVRNQTDSSADKVLWVLRLKNGTATPTEICRMLRVTTPRVTSILNNMEEKGLITRTINKKDRRGIVVSMTAKARRYEEKREREAKEWLTRMIDEVGEACFESVIAYLKAAERISQGDSL